MCGGPRTLRVFLRNERHAEPTRQVRYRGGRLRSTSAATHSSDTRPDNSSQWRRATQMPAIYSLRDFAADGGLISYGNSIPDAYRARIEREGMKRSVDLKAHRDLGAGAATRVSCRIVR